MSSGAFIKATFLMLVFFFFFFFFFCCFGCHGGVSSMEILQHVEARADGLVTTTTTTTTNTATDRSATVSMSVEMEKFPPFHQNYFRHPKFAETYLGSSSFGRHHHQRQRRQSSADAHAQREDRRMPSPSFVVFDLRYSTTLDNNDAYENVHLVAALQVGYKVT